MATFTSSTQSPRHITLKYFLSAEGIKYFRSWYLEKTTLQSSWKELDDYVAKLLSTQWTDDAARDVLRTAIRAFLESHLLITYQKKPYKIFQDWLDEMKPYCLQGGYGYAFSYPDSPHHWIIKPEFYDLVSKIPEEVAIAACILDKFIEIAKTAKTERWGS